MCPACGIETNRPAQHVKRKHTELKGKEKDSLILAIKKACSTDIEETLDTVVDSEAPCGTTKNCSLRKMPQILPTNP